MRTHQRADAACGRHMAMFTVPRMVSTAQRKPRVCSRPRRELQLLAARMSGASHASACEQIEKRCNNCCRCTATLTAPDGVSDSERDTGRVQSEALPAACLPSKPRSPIGQPTDQPSAKFLSAPVPTEAARSVACGLDCTVDNAQELWTSTCALVRNTTRSNGALHRVALPSLVRAGLSALRQSRSGQQWDA